MATMELTVEEGIHILSLTNGDNDNAFTLDVLGEYLAALDAVDSYRGDTALLITCEHGKTFSTGINLQWLMEQSAEGQKEFVTTLERLLYRLALLSAPTVVCLNGNAYAGGAILAAAADFRVMRADRGRICYPEVNIKIPFTPMMMDVVKLLPNHHALKTMLLTGQAYTGLECEAFNLVDAVFPADTLRAEALALAKSLGEKDRATYASIRNELRLDITRHGGALGFS